MAEPSIGARKESLLQARAVVKVLGGTRVLRGLDAVFEPGAIHVIEGANGAGKSTLLAVLSGRASTTSGLVSFRSPSGQVRSGPQLRATVGWLGHELGLYLDLTAHENIAFHARLRGVDAASAWARCAGRLDLSLLANRRLREMSRGQRQRVALGRALLGDPPVLLLDEPSTGLDAASTERVSKVLEEVTREGTIVVLVTHDPAFRERLDGRKWVLREGKLTAPETLEM